MVTAGFRRAVGPLLLLAFGVALGFVAGSRYFGENMTSYRALQTEHRQLQREFAAREQRLVNLETADQVNRASLERLRGMVGDLEARLARQQEELHLYENLVAEGDAAMGLSLENFSLRATGEPRVFDYRIVVRRKAALSQPIEASVTLDIEGRRHGIPYAASFNEVDLSLREKVVDIRFRYFKVLRGRFVLPRHFEPERVVFSLYEADNPEAAVTREIPWQPADSW